MAGWRPDAGRTDAQDGAVSLPLLAAAGARRRADTSFSPALGAGGQGFLLSDPAFMARTFRATRRTDSLAARRAGGDGDCLGLGHGHPHPAPERKSTRLNSRH